MLLAACLLPLHAQQRGGVEKPPPLGVVEIKEPGGQILSYRYGSSSTEVRMRGTKLAREARIKLKVGSRPGFTEIDINRGDVTGLMPAHQFGKDFLTYVLWAVSVDGKASNLGEVTFDGAQPISINVTTPYQTFWLMLTAEPDYAVVDPSPQVILYSFSADQGAREPSGDRALTIKGELFFFTHYMTYDSSPGNLERAPNELLQARKALELASKSGILAVRRAAGVARLREEERTRQVLDQAKAALAQAEDAYRKNPQGREVVQFARTAAQIAENARALAGGAVGGALVRQLEDQLADLRVQFANLEAESSKLRAELARSGDHAQALSAPAKEPVQTTVDGPQALASKPIVWFGLLGWALAVLLLFRRRSV
ncbi:MAG: hypothetical protein ACRD6I_11075 [Candidatus Acidiferrales bacterium]